MTTGFGDRRTNPHRFALRIGWNLRGQGRPQEPARPDLESSTSSLLNLSHMRNSATRMHASTCSGVNLNSATNIPETSRALVYCVTDRREYCLPSPKGSGAPPLGFLVGVGFLNINNAAQQLLRASLGGIASPDRQVSSQPKVTSETITADSRKESRRPNPIPQRDILLGDDFGSRRTLASPLAGRQVPVVSA